jgi:uncharacterized protein YoxC/DNA-binding ferritin-like protein
MSLNIIIDADVQSATQKIGKFVYTMKKDFQEVEKTVRRTSTTVKESTDKMAEAANSFGKSSRNSLTALSLTLQDLPFGFIGIQNNLPGIIQGFGQMSAEAKTGASVMTQLKTALLGPAGLFLAFSAVTAAVTALTMKYGSLGNAVDALFGKINPLSKVIKDAAKSQEDLNESYKTNGQIIASATGSVDAQILKVKLLSDTVKNLSNSEELRKNALYELQKIDKAYFGQITTAIGDVGKLEEATRKYTDAILANAIAKGYEAKLTEAAINLEEQRNALKDLAPAYAEATKKQKEFLESYADAYDPVTGAKILQPGFIANADIVAFNKQKLVVDAAVITLDKLKESFSNATLEATKFVEPVEKAAKALKGIKIGTIIDSGELGPGRLVDTLEAFQAYVRGNINIQKNSIDKILTARLDYRRKELQENFLLPKKIDKNAGPLNKNPLIEYQFGQITAIIDALKEEAKFIDDAFREPLENLFVDFLQKGKLSFEDFTKSVMRNITQLVAKLAASKLFEALANLIPQIAGTLVPGGTGLMELTNILGRGRNIFGAANLGGIGGGGMNLNGQVVFVQRGTDLVGVMNRTNAQIQRIG